MSRADSAQCAVTANLVPTDGHVCGNRAAICLCGTRNCRGSFLYFAGNKAFMQVLNARHTMLHRQAILLRASTEKVTQQDRELLEVSQPRR